MNRDTSANPNPLKITKVVSEQITPSRSSFLHIKKGVFSVVNFKKKKKTCNRSHMVILLYSVSATLPPQLPSFSQSFFFLLFFVLEAIFPRLIQQINSAFWLLTKRKKGKKNTFNICNTCPSSFNCGIQRLFNRLLAALSCRSKQPHKAANYSINFPTLRRSQGWGTRGGCNQRRFGGGKLTNGDTHGTGLFGMCAFLASRKTTTSPKEKKKKCQVEVFISRCKE